MSEHIVPRKTYYTVFALLMALTASTVGIALIDLGLRTRADGRRSILLVG